MALPVSFWGQTINDNTLKPNGEPETATFRLPIVTLTAANLVATQTLLSNLAGGVSGVTLGNVGKTVTILEEIIGSNTPASSVLAQRENKYLLRMHDVTSGQKFRASLPTADLSILPDHSEFLDLTTGPGQTLKDALEAVVRSPYDVSHSVVLDSVQFVGRNS